ncbi:MAG: hypothetical protein NT027_00505 [Proteobacteria bacterium]|nr:hypothetical protein [Pseudomonadota bacterium]
MTSPLDRVGKGLEYKLSILVIILFGIVGASSCRSRSNIEQSNSLNRSKTDQSLVTVHEDFSPAWIPVRIAGDGFASEIASIHPSSCIESRFRFKTVIFSAGQPSELKYEQDWKSEFAIFSLGESRFKIPVSLDSELKRVLCDSIQTSKISIFASNVLIDKFQSLVDTTLRSATTDCLGIEMIKNGWECRLVKLMPQSAIVKIEDFQLGMTRKWSRQPYVLARRAGLTMSLAKASLDVSSEGNLFKFCKLIKFSQREEMPLVMASTRWQAALCSGSVSERRDAALFGLYKAVEEISILKRLFESSSRPGNLSIRIPETELPKSDPQRGLVTFRVIFVPDVSVSERLIQVAANILNVGPYESTPSKYVSKVDPGEHLHSQGSLGSSCWHPFFSDSKVLFEIAKGMMLIKNGVKATCSIPQNVPGSGVDGEDIDQNRHENLEIASLGSLRKMEKHDGLAIRGPIDRNFGFFRLGSRISARHKKLERKPLKLLNILKI